MVKDDGVEVPFVVLLCVAVFMFGIILGASCDLSISVSSRQVPANSAAVEVESEETGDSGTEKSDPVVPATTTDDQ